MDDDPWISWKMAQTDDELHESGQSHEKAERSDCDTKGYADPVNVSFFFFSSFAAVGSGGVRARPRPAEFPLLRKGPLINCSAVSEISFEIFEQIGLRFLAG